MNKLFKLTKEIYLQIRPEKTKEILGYSNQTIKNVINEKKLTDKQAERVKEHLGEWIDDIHARYMEVFKS